MIPPDPDGALACPLGFWRALDALNSSRFLAAARALTPRRKPDEASRPQAGLNLTWILLNLKVLNV